MNNLQASEGHFHAIVNQAMAGISETDLDGNHSFVNQKFCDMLGYTEAELLKMNIRDFTHPDDISLCLASIARTIETDEAVVNDKRLIHKSGKIIWVNDSIAAIAATETKTQTVIAVAVDITEKKRTEQIIGEKETLQKFVAAQENERKRIARDIHDHIGQSIVGLQLNLQFIREKYKEDLVLEKDFEKLQKIVSKLNSDADFLAWELRPSVLDDLGLTLALTDYVKEWSIQFQTPAEFRQIGLNNQKFLPEIEINLYRIAQEALNNAAKHASAEAASIILEKRDSHIILIIEDNGKGFNPRGKARITGDDKGMGLLGMKERAEMIKGTVEIESSPNKGTTIYVKVPARFIDE